MAMWQAITLKEDGVRAWYVDLSPNDPTSDLRMVSGDFCSVAVDGGPVDVRGNLAPDAKTYPLRDPQGVPLTSLENTLETIGQTIDAIQVTGLGHVTLYARRDT